MTRQEDQLEEGTWDANNENSKHFSWDDNFSRLCLPFFWDSPAQDRLQSFVVLCRSRGFLSASSLTIKIISIVTCYSLQLLVFNPLFASLTSSKETRRCTKNINNQILKETHIIELINLVTKYVANAKHTQSEINEFCLSFGMLVSLEEEKMSRHIYFMFAINLEFGF